MDTCRRSSKATKTVFSGYYSLVDYNHSRFTILHNVTACGKNEYWYIDVRNLIGTRERPLTEQLL